MTMNERPRQETGERDRHEIRGINHTAVPDFEMRSNGSLAFKGEISRGFFTVRHGETIRGTGKTARNRVRGR